MYSLFNLKASIDFYFLLYLNEAEKHCGKSVALDVTCKHTKKQNKVLNWVANLTRRFLSRKLYFFKPDLNEVI